MAKIDRFRSPEEVERLADLKRGVNLVALATERYGLTITDKSRDDSAYTLENKAQGERITVKVGPEGYHIYNNHNNDRDKGSVVDFLQQRHPDRNLGQIKGMLQEMVPGAKQALDYEKFAAQQVQKAPSAADARYEALPPAARRAAMVRETMGPNPQLTDASYLLERGLTKETVNDPAFKGRVFTDQHPERQERLGKPQHNVGFPFYNEKGVQSWELRNRAPEGETDSFKMMMKAPGDEFGAKNGVWSSNLLQGKGSQPERMVIGESPIDMMSKYQTERAAAAEKGQDLPNSRYVATGGTPSIEQKAIIQAIIDREKPKQVILSNDNDAAGQAFNVRYLNDLRPPVAGLSPEQQAEAAAARERISWIAGDNGKKGDEKLLTMTISFQHGTAKEGRDAVESLRTQAEMRGLPAEEPTTPGTAGLQLRRNTPEVTEVVLRVSPTEADAVVDLARELRREREQAMPEAARTPENYFVVEKANGKDYNQDILQGRANAQLDAARERAGFQEPTPEQAPAKELRTATLLILDTEATNYSTKENDNGVGHTAKEISMALFHQAGLQATLTPVPGDAFERPVLATEITFQYQPGSENEKQAKELLALVQNSGDNRMLASGIEPEAPKPGEASAFPEGAAFVSGLPVPYAALTLTSKEGVDTLEERLRAGGIAVVPAELENERGVLVLLERGNTREAALLENVIALHSQENTAPLTINQSEQTKQERLAGAASYQEAAVPEAGLSIAQIRVTDNEALPAGVQAPDDRFRSLAQEVQTALEATGMQVAALPVPAEGPLVKTYLEFEYAPGSASHQAAQQVLANAQGNAPDRIALAGIEPAGEVQADSRYHIGLSLATTPVALAATENDAVLKARLDAAELTFAPTQVAQQPGYVVLLDSSNAREAAALDRIITLHERETGTPLTVLQSEDAQRVRQEGVSAYYDPERGGHSTPPPLVGVAIVNDRHEEDAVEERLRNVGAKVTQVPQTEAQQEVNAPDVFLRVEYPLDNAGVTANVSRLLNEFEVTSENNWNREAREQLRVGQGEPRIDVEFLGRTEVIEAIAAEDRQRDASRTAAAEQHAQGIEAETAQERHRIAAQVAAAEQEGKAAEPTFTRIVQDPELDATKLGYPGLATAAVGYRSDLMPTYIEQMETAGARVIERPVSELAPAGSVSFAYPLDQPEVVARVSGVLDGINADAEARTQRLGELAGLQDAAGVYELPAYRETRQQAALAVEQSALEQSATVAIGYPGNQEHYKKNMEQAGATLIDQPVSENAPAGTYSIRYPNDRPEVAARVGEILDEIQANARTGSRPGADTPVGIFERPEDEEKRRMVAASYGGPDLGQEVRNENQAGARAAEQDFDREIARQAKEQQPGPEQKGPDQIAADINLNGSTSAAEIIRADANRDGVVTETELNTARFEINQAKERGTAEQTGQTEAERQAEIRRRYEEQRQEAQAQQEQAAATRDTSGPLRSAGIVIFEAEGLPAGTLAAGSATLVTMADKMKEAIEAQGSEVSVREGRDATTGQPYSMLAFSYHEGSAEHGKIQEALRDAQRDGGVSKYFGIEPGVETQRETAPITRTVALNEQPLAIALDAPNPLLESQLRATGATVSNEPVQERPGLVVVVDTQKGEQLAGVEQTLSKLPPAAVVVEVPEATEMRQQLTQTFREQGGITPPLQAEAILPERIQHDVPERLREAGAIVAPAPYATRPELPEGSLTVRYSLEQPDVLGRVSVVLDEVNSRSAQVATDLGKTPDVATGSVVETLLAQQTRQLVAKEQGMEATGPRELPERQPTEDRTIARPKEVVIDAAPLFNHDSQALGSHAANFPAARQISAEPEPHAVERRIILDISNEKPGLAPTLEAVLTKGGFQVATAPLEAVGEDKGGTRIEALYRTTDSVAQREQQAGVLRNIAKMDQTGMSLREPEGQDQERAAALKGPGKPEAGQMVAAGQTLRASITVLEVDGEKDRATRLWTDLRDAGAKVGHVAKTELPGEGTKYAFPVEYRPSDTRLPVVSATLEAAARGEGIQVLETDNMRLERLARTSARESKDLAALSPEARDAYKRPEPKDYSASRPDAYERVALSAEELKSPAAVKALREELKETGAVVAVQQLDGRPAGSGTLTLSFIADAPKADAVNEVLRAVAEKGATVYDLKAGHDRGAEPAQVAVEAARGPLSAEQERQANLAELQTLEARRDALRASQLEATTRSQLAEQYLVPAAAAAGVAVEKVEVKPWVGFGPDLRGEDLRNTDATGMDLRGANLAGQDLRSTDLRGSDLREANLTGADLRGANLTGVRLEDAVLDGANLEKAFRVVETEGGKRQMEENLTPVVLTGPERDGASYAPTVAFNEQRLATPEMVAAGEDNSPAASPRIAMLQAPQYSGLNLPTEEEMRAQVQQPPVVAQVEESQPAVQPLPPMPGLQQGSESEPGQVAQVPPSAPVVELPGLNLPIQQELSFGPPPVEPVMELPAVAPSSQEPGKGQATAEAVGLEVPGPVSAPGTLSRYEQLEEAGTTLHTASVYITQPVGEAGVEKADGADRVKEIQERLVAAGAEVEVSPPTPDASGKTETSVLRLVYTHDDRELPAVHQALNDVATVPAGADYGVRVADENAAARTATVESRMENTPEAAKALAAELHDGSDTARVLVQRPALEDVWALEDAGAKVERIYLPDGPAAMVSYPAGEPGVTSAVSIELDRIERDSTLTRPPHNSNDREVSGPLLGEDPAQQERRQGMARAEGLVLEPQPRYGLNEMGERDARAKAYFQEEIARPSDALTGQLANGEPFKGGVTEVLRLEQPDRDALEAGWKAEKTTLLLVVQETPELRMEDGAPAPWPARVAEALREAGAEAEVKPLGVSADTGLDKHLIAVSFDNNDPALARIQATLNRLADQDGVQVPTEGYWQRETILGPNGSRMAEPVVAERDRPWLEAVVAINEPTDQERRELTRAGARIEDALFEGSDKPAILVYYNLDNPTEVAKVSAVLDRADEQGRGLGETWEAGQARGGRVEQYQHDIRQEKQQDGAAWDQFAQKYPTAGAKVENEVAEPAVALSFADRLRAAVNDQLADIRLGWEAAAPANVAVYSAEQRGIADRKALEQQQAAEAAAAPQKQREKEAYERGFNGTGAAPGEQEKAAGEKAGVPSPALADAAAAAALAGGVVAGTHGTSAELASDKILRERRDDELTKPIVMDGPKEGKILETTEQVVKPSTVGSPDQEKAAGEKAVTPPVVETPAVAAAVVTAREAEKPREQELQYGIIGMEGTSRKSAEDRMEMVRAAMLNAGAQVDQVVPSSRDNKAATLAYSYDPMDSQLPAINKVLQDVHTSQPSMIKEEPHSLHYAGIKPNAHEIERRDWPEREGQFAKAQIVVDDFDQKGTSRAENIKGDLAREGAIVGEVKKDGHGHVELNVTYHTHSPNIEKINNTFDKAGNSAGIEVRELDTDRSARYQGAIDQLQGKGVEKERERGE